MCILFIQPFSFLWWRNWTFKYEIVPYTQSLFYWLVSQFILFDPIFSIWVIMYTFSSYKLKKYIVHSPVKQNDLFDAKRKAFSSFFWKYVRFLFLFLCYFEKINIKSISVLLILYFSFYMRYTASYFFAFGSSF